MENKWNNEIGNNKILLIEFLVLSLTLIIFSLNFISAEVGCCFDASSGICSYNADSSSCSGSGAEFYSTPSCSIAKCDKGCCVLGDKVRYGTSRTCELDSRAYGFSFPESFQMIPEADCLKLANAQSKGACLYGGDYEKNCKYTTFGQCSSADFYAGVFCTEPSLNTTCKNTSKTMCYEGNVYHKDSCGNPAGKKQECNFQAGSICKQTSNSSDAYCKSLNCFDPIFKKTRKNGESWCVNPGDAALGSSSSTGSKTGKVISLTGKLVSHSGPGVPITRNPRANPRVTPSSSGTCGTVQNTSRCKTEGGKTLCCEDSWDLCGEDMCNRCMSEVFKYGGGDERVKGCVFGERCGGGGGEGSNVGDRYFRQYCLDGEVITEPCADFRMESCEMGDGGASECVINDYSTCVAANNAADTTGTSTADYGAPTSQVDEEACSEESCNFMNPGGNNILLNGMNLQLCTPKVAPGLQFYPSQDGGASSVEMSDGVCSNANYQMRFKFKRSKSCEAYYVSGTSTLVKLAEKGAGLWDSCLDGWTGPNWFENSEGDLCTMENYVCNEDNFLNKMVVKEGLGTCGDKQNPTGDYVGCVYAACIAEGKKDSMPINSELVSILQGRCRAMGDCDGKGNWVGAEPGYVSDGNLQEGEETENDTIYYIPCTATRSSDHTHTVICTLDYQCKIWNAPSEGECEVCGMDNLPCSEYRCRALGKNCEYKEPGGADKGYCVSTSDHTPPKISLKSQNPGNPIPPYTPVEFIITTDEESECKFNFNSAGGKYSEMKYNFGSGWGVEHKVILNLPGQRKNDLGVLEYPLIQEGQNTLYVRCVDAKGNGEIMSPYPINFEVMKTPDTIAPIIGKFNPISGSPIKYNTTSKTINFGINEPSECKWDYNDKDFLNMTYNFACDRDVTTLTLVNGYSCSGILANVTTNMSSQTKFYIRCKDQPWLEGKEDALYRRNTHQKSQEYILRPSLPLEITNVAPQGIIKKNPVNTSFEMRAFTSQGGFNGISNCSWRLSNSINIQSSFRIFKDTNKNIHTQLITGNLSDGTYYAEVMCFDSAGNEANRTFSFDFRLDREAPFIVRLLHNNGLLLKTDEDAMCYFSNNKANGCFYDITNGTLMSGIQVEHKADWVYDSYYYVKCKDYYDNWHSGCGVVVRTY